MTILMQREFNRLKKSILALSAQVEEHVNQSVQAVINRDTLLAQRIIDRDHEVDAREIEVEEECLKILALHQPVAADLRFIVSILKINNDLERVGDLAVSISKNVISLSRITERTPPFDLAGMADIVSRMLRKSLDSLVNLDQVLAEEVRTMDDSVDEINRDMYTRVKKCISAHINDIDFPLYYLTISRRLERIADHATNIAEDVLYMTKGHIVRHPTTSRDIRNPL
ncbi:MAG: phosphate signaling complex protein PhoU [Chitinivibrionales bacterium]|nr:phosphate signaling complex protein PhoU [Chitinivibrionales bacterium]MBD3358391.1 phosphate signaling complex protein PhoU [Chitinivibrionales bacterium]